MSQQRASWQCQVAMHRAALASWGQWLFLCFGLPSTRKMLENWAVSSGGLWSRNPQDAQGEAERDAFVYVENRGPRRRWGSDFCSLQKMEPDFSQMHSERTRDNGHYPNCSKTHSDLIYGKNSPPRGWSSTGRSCWERLWNRPSQGLYKSGWTGSQATWLNLDISLALHGGLD